MRKLLVVALVLVVLPGAAFATDARIESLGGKEKAWTVSDEMNALYLPATVLLFPNTVWVDVGGTTASGTPVFLPVTTKEGVTQPVYIDGGTAAYGLEDAATGKGLNGGFGMYYALGPDTVVGFYGSSMRRYVSADVLAKAFKWDAADLNTEEEGGQRAIHGADHKGSFLIGQRFGKSVRTGLQLGVWGDAYEVTSPQTKQIERGGTLMDARLGLGVDMAHDNSFDLALGARIGMFNDHQYQKDRVVTRLKGSTQWEMDLLVRAVLDVPGGEKVVPYLDAGLGGQGVKWNEEMQNPPSADGSSWWVTAGMDLLVQPLDMLKLWPGLGVAMRGVKVEDTGETVQDDMLTMPFFGVAVDAGVSSWLSLRFAARQGIQFLSAADAETEYKESAVLTEVRVGAGMRFGNAGIDLMLNPELFTTGPNLLSGKDLDDGFATEASFRLTW